MLGYLIIHFEQEEQKEILKRQELIVNHMSRTLSNPQSKEQAKALQKFTKQLEKSVDSNTDKPKGPQSRADLQWSDDTLARLKRLEGR